MRALPLHRVRAVNTAADSENKIHDDRVAAAYGFRGGLVPGVTVYGYMTAPIVEYAPEWLDRGAMQVRFLEPCYDGDPVIVRAEVDETGAIQVRAEREDGTLCAAGTARVLQAASEAAAIAEAPLPADRPVPSSATIRAGASLGTVIETLDLANRPLTAALLQFSNEMLVRNFLLGPWIHVASDLVNHGTAQHGEQIRAAGRIQDRFDRKGHEFIVIDVLLTANGRPVQTNRHTAIYRPRQV